MNTTSSSRTDKLAAAGIAENHVRLVKCPERFKVWGELMEYVEDRDHADYRDFTVGDLLHVYFDGEPDRTILAYAVEGVTFRKGSPVIDRGERHHPAYPWSVIDEATGDVLYSATHDLCVEWVLTNADPIVEVEERPWIARPPVGVEPARDQGQEAIDTAIGFILGELDVATWASKRAAIMDILDENVVGPVLPPNAVAVTRADAITAAGGCALAAEATLRQVKHRRNAGEGNASHRQWLRDLAASYETAGKRLQRAADEAF